MICLTKEQLAGGHNCNSHLWSYWQLCYNKYRLLLILGILVKRLYDLLSICQAMPLSLLQLQIASYHFGWCELMPHHLFVGYHFQFKCTISISFMDDSLLETTVPWLSKGHLTEQEMCELWLYSCSNVKEKKKKNQPGDIFNISVPFSVKKISNPILFSLLPNAMTSCRQMLHPVGKGMPGRLPCPVCPSPPPFCPPATPQPIPLMACVGGHRTSHWWF